MGDSLIFGGKGRARQKSGPTTHTQTGYLNTDVGDFKSSGDALSTENSASVDMIGQKTRSITQDVPTVIGHGDNKKLFPGQFSDATTDQLQSLVNVFEARRQGILQKKRQPGRSILMAEG